MIDREHDLSVTKQAEILRISRGSVYYLPRPVSSADLEIMQRLWLHLEYPFAGSRMLRGLLALQGCKVGRRHVKTLMSDPIQSVFDACSFEENKLAMVIQDASPSIEKRSVARILSELRFHARACMQNQIRQNQERAQVCLLQTEIR